MKLKTSFFNPTLYKKDVTRFTPLWAIYTVAMLLLMLSLMNVPVYVEVDYRAYLVGVVEETIPALSVLNLIYGIMAAQLLFGELFNARLCNALHAMPVRREARFCSHLAAGLSFSLVPNLLISMLMMTNLGPWWYAALLWLLAMTLQYLCFFGIAVLSMHCTGNRFASVLVYAIINFVSMAALWFAYVIFVPQMWGVVLTGDVFLELSPVVKMCTLNNFFEMEYLNVSPRFTWGTQWPVLCIYAAVGIAAMVGALLIYRCRALESAGDFMAVKVLKPIFLVIYTLCVGVFFALFGSLFSDDTYLTFLIVGLVVGFFTGKMLLERMVRVFNLKSILQLVALLVLMWLSLVAVQEDWFGIVRYVPEAEQVEKAEVVMYNYGRNKVTVSDNLELEVLQNAHKLALQEDGCKHDDQRRYEITYFMKNGRTVKREYTLCGKEEAAAELEKLFRSPQAIFGYQGHWDDYTRNVTAIEINGSAREITLNSEDRIRLLDQLYADCENGTISLGGGKYGQYEVIIYSPDKTVYLETRENSLAYSWLRSYEKTEMLHYLKEITAITLDKELVDQTHYEELVSALYDDARENGIGWRIFEEMKWDAAYHLVIKTKDETEEILPVGEFAGNTYVWIKDYLYGIGELE